MKIQNHTGRISPYLRVPRALADLLPVGMNYEVALTDEGILYKPVGFDKPGDTYPAWTQQSNES